MTLATYYSYAAGSRSLDPAGFREIGGDAGNRLHQLQRVFPTLREILHLQTLVISAYPATLGLTSCGPSIDTYLHPPTFIRAMRLAHQQARCVLMASQPLLGADLWLQYCQSNYPLPPRVLWATGGYPLPQSLERFVRELLESRGCRLQILHAYGVAEIGHTLFAAIQRRGDGSPIYQLVADATEATIQSNGRLRLSIAKVGNCSARSVQTEDYATLDSDGYRLTSGPGRFDPDVGQILESWGSEQWQTRTGYLATNANGRYFQQRSLVADCSNMSCHSFDVEYFEFWRRFGGSWSTKPRWGTS